jgi:hypothetical protein
MKIVLPMLAIIMAVFIVGCLPNGGYYIPPDSNTTQDWITQENLSQNLSPDLGLPPNLTIAPEIQNITWTPNGTPEVQNITPNLTKALCLNNTFWCSNATLKGDAWYCGIDEFIQCNCNDSGCINTTNTTV